MENPEQIEKELSYVRGLVSRSERDKAPGTIYLMWAVICLVGFPLADFAPRYLGLYWMIAGPLGTIMSAVLGWRHSAKIGQVNQGLGIRHGKHWVATLVAIFLTVPLGVKGFVEWGEVHRIMLLILALSYFLAGVHLEPPIMWIGLLMAGAYVALFFIAGYKWTFVGVVVALALGITGAKRGRKRVEEGE